MKIALISYEYPPDTAYGGIATYMYQVAKMLMQRSHHVEVFACSLHRSGTSIEEGITVHRILAEEDRNNQHNFAGRIAKIFAARHLQVDFDVLEGAEIGAHTREVLQFVPEIPLVIKLHTPTFICSQLGYVKLPLELKARIILGALRRGKKPELRDKPRYDIENDIERLHTLEADEITTPSIAMGEKLIDIWQLPKDKLVHIPNPYIPADDLLRIPIETKTNVISFIGRLEMRKGITELTEAIPLIIKNYPDVRFRFIGESCRPSPNFRLDMQEYIEKRLRRYIKSLEFTGYIPLDMIPNMLSSTDICVFPSRWENFPNVCLEAMAAGRGVVGSNAGGMADMLSSDTGLLIPPYSPPQIAKAVLSLLKEPNLRMSLGTAARDRVLNEYNLEKIGCLQEDSYIRAIKRRKILGKRNESSNH
jgi:glycosyltransferase involved in cell wall biosynthesis